MGCCLAGCVRLLAFALWRAIFAALLAILLARIDSYLERSRYADSLAGRAWRTYRARGKKRGGAAPTSVPRAPSGPRRPPTDPPRP